ncbi:MAG: RNA-binding S4 domain-containing protein [Pseudomonadota bacterium]
MQTVYIHSEPVELYKILKFEGLVNSGGDAKLCIDNELVSVNGDIETRRRRKIVSGDVITFQEYTLRVLLENT